MKNIALIVMCICFSYNGFAQNSQCDSVKKKNDQLTESIKALSKENEYFRKSLNILKPIKSVEQGGLTFNLTKCEGNIKEQTITLTCFIINHKANSEFQFEKANLTDIQGNNFLSYDFKIGNQDVRNMLFTDTPLGTKITFKNVLPSTQMIKMIGLSYYGTGLFEKGTFIFNDIAVAWK